MLSSVPALTMQSVLLAPVIGILASSEWRHHRFLYKYHYWMLKLCADYFSKAVCKEAALEATIKTCVFSLLAGNIVFNRLQK